MDIRKKVADDLDVPMGLITDALSLSRVHVKKLYLKKRDGTLRIVHQPSKKLKTIQYWLIHNILSKLPVHDSSIAYVEGQSILSNATRHRKNRFFLKMDFKNFFPSIVWGDLEPILCAWHEIYRPSWDFDEAAKDIIRNSCFFSEDRLPIGYPSSPVISNSVMFSADRKICDMLSESPAYGRAIYTRYADDIVISTNEKHVCRKIQVEVSKIIEAIESPKLKINHRKTKLGSSSSGSAIVTGLRICPKEHVTIHRMHKDRIRLFLSLYRKGKLASRDRESLLGHLAYVRHVAPQFYSTIQKKYFAEIARLRKSQSRKPDHSRSATDAE